MRHFPQCGNTLLRLHSITADRHLSYARNINLQLIKNKLVNWIDVMNKLLRPPNTDNQGTLFVTLFA